MQIQVLLSCVLHLTFDITLLRLHIGLHAQYSTGIFSRIVHAKGINKAEWTALKGEGLLKLKKESWYK